MNKHRGNPEVGKIHCSGMRGQLRASRSEGGKNPCKCELRLLFPGVEKEEEDHVTREKKSRGKNNK